MRAAGAAAILPRPTAGTGGAAAGCGRRGSAGELVLAVWRLPEHLGTAAARQLKVLQRRRGGGRPPAGPGSWPQCICGTLGLCALDLRAEEGVLAVGSLRRPLHAGALPPRARARARPPSAAGTLPPCRLYVGSQCCHAQVTAASIRRAQAAQAVAACLARQAFHWLLHCNYFASISLPAVRSACSSSSCSAACRGGPLGISAVGPHGRSLHVLPQKLCTAAKPLQHPGCRQVGSNGSAECCACTRQSTACTSIVRLCPPVHGGQVPGEGCAHNPAAWARQQHAGPAASPSAACPQHAARMLLLFLLCACACALHICAPAIN